MQHVLEDDATRVFSQVLGASHVNVVFDAKISAPAAYDAKSNTVFIGQLIESQAHLRHGLAIHEIGHKMFSGLDKLFDDPEAPIVKRFMKIKRIFNIVDDGFQERCMVARFPGAKKHLQAIFDEFIDNQVEPDPDKPELPIIIQILNTLNFNCKGKKYGKSREYPTEIKPELLRVCREAEIWHSGDLEARVTICEEIKKLLAELTEEKKQQPQPSQKRNEKEEGEEVEQPNSESEESDDEEHEQQTTSESNAEEGDEEDVVDSQLDEFADSLNDHHDKFKLADVGDTVSLLTYQELCQVARIIDITHTVENDGEQASLKGTGFSNVGRIQKNYGEHLAKTRETANIIFSKFTSMVQARNHINTRYLKSGRIDLKRLPLYRLNDDIFQNVSVHRNNANHAFLVMLDWSASMQTNIMRLVDRVLELSHFAKMAEIELEVWLYTNENANTNLRDRCIVFFEKNKYKNFVFNSSRFIRVLNTKQHRNMQLNDRMYSLFALASLQANQAALLRRNWNGSFSVAQQRLLNNFSMNSTNIQEAIIFASGRMAEIQADNKTIFMLTDGADDKDYSVIMRDGKLIIRNKKSSYGIDIPRSIDLLHQGRSLKNVAIEDNDEQYTYHRQTVNRYLAKHSSVEMIGIGWDYAGAKYIFSEEKTIIIKTNENKKSLSSLLSGVDDNTSKIKGRDFVKIDNQILDSIVKHLLGSNQ